MSLAHLTLPRTPALLAAIKAARSSLRRGAFWHGLGLAVDLLDVVLRATARRASGKIVDRSKPFTLDVGKICTRGTHMVRISVPTPAPAHGHRPDCSAPCPARPARGAAALLAPRRCHRRTVPAHTVAPRSGTLRRPCGEDARPVGRPSKARTQSLYLTSHLITPRPTPVRLQQHRHSWVPFSTFLHVQKPTPTSAPEWASMTLVGEIFLLFDRARLHPFLEKWILLPHDDMPHTQRRQQY